MKQQQYAHSSYFYIKIEGVLLTAIIENSLHWSFALIMQLAERNTWGTGH